MMCIACHVLVYSLTPQGPRDLQWMEGAVHFEMHLKESPPVDRHQQA